MITKTFMIDCPSIININRLFDIDCYRLPLIIDFINCPGPAQTKILWIPELVFPHMG